MKPNWFFPITLCLPHALVAAQSTGVVVSDPPTPPRSPAPQLGDAQFLNRDDGVATRTEAIFASDDVPLPVPAQVETGPDGDHVTRPASGNPYFLGFAAGPYYPPSDERIDPELLRQVRSHYDDGRTRQETFAFCMFQKRITPERVAELESLGVRVLGFHPHYALRVAIPVGALETVASQPFVRWVGVARPWQKLHPRLQEQLSASKPNEPLDVYVSVFDSDLNEASTTEEVGDGLLVERGVVVEDESPDRIGRLGRRVQSNGWQQRTLEEVGVEVREYVDSVRAFKARVYPASLDMLAQRDNVQFIEVDVKDELDHDESMPMIMADQSRVSYDGNAGAILGIIDSGVDFGHTALNHITGIGWDFTSSPGGAWTDGCEHGSHVSGTMFAQPLSNALEHTGVLPRLAETSDKRYYNVKYFSDTCGAAGVSHATLYDRMRFGTSDQRPHAINNSWGASGSWVGTEANARILDHEVWVTGQLYVFSAGNDGATGSIGLPAVAKNAFTVGSVNDYRSSAGDPGVRSSFSSRGPTLDGRWKPNVVAPGSFITSVDANSTDKFRILNGTSMAAPHVTGVAGQVSEAYFSMRYNAQRTASILMATATPKDDTVIQTPSNPHLDEYGTGRINGIRALFGSPGWSWQNWNIELSGNGSGFADFTVPPGTKRIVACMRYHETAASSGASKALVNDYDLWLDQAPIDPTGNSGEWFAQQSTIDNTEIRALNNPKSGAWRWKVYPDNVTGSTTRISVTVAYIFEDPTPAGALTLAVDETIVQPGDDVQVTATAENPEFMASAVFVDSTAPGASLQSSTVTLKDGIVCDMMDNAYAGNDVLLGDIQRASSRSVNWTTRWNSEGVKTFQVDARSENWIDRSASVQVTVDGTAPGTASNIQSTTHTPGVWSNDPNITYTWASAQDALAGLAGYGVSTRNQPALPAPVQDIGDVTTYSEVLATNAQPYFFNLRSLDKAGNWDDEAASSSGYRIDLDAPGGASNVSSTSHQVGQSSCDATVAMKWKKAADAHSGLAGYKGVFTTKPGTVPGGALNIGAGATQNQQTIGSGTWYFHLRSRDKAGNWGPTIHTGPFVIDEEPLEIYCTPKVNSCTLVPRIGFSGAPKASQTSGFKIFCDNTKAKKVGSLMYTTGGPGNFPFQGGILCINPAPLKRTVKIFDTQGSGNNCDGRLEIDMSAFAHGQLGGNPLPALLIPGTRINCQFSGRDTIAAGALLSDAIEYTVCP